MNHQVRKITEGAMMCALFGMVLLINRQFAEVFEVFFVFVLPLPLIVYTAKYGFKYGCICATSICFLSLMISSITSMVYSIASVIIGLVYGTLVGRRASNGLLLIITMILTVILEVFCCIVFASVFGYNVFEDAQMMMEAFKMAFVQTGVAFPEVFNMNTFVMIAIVSVILTGVIEAVLVHLLANLVMKRLRIESKPISPLSLWYVPKWIGYLCFALFLAMQGVMTIQVNETLRLVVMACGIIATFVLVMFGYIACLIFGMVKYKKNITLILILLFVFIYPFLAVVGFFYITSDLKQELLRRRDENE